MATPALVAELQAKYPNLEVLTYKALATLQIKLRDAATPPVEFKQYADRLMRCVRALFGLSFPHSAGLTAATAGSWRRRAWRAARARRPRS